MFQAVHMEDIMEKTGARKMDKKKGKYFVFISADEYPEGSAGATRTHSFAEICKNLGYQPIVIGMGKSTGFQYKQFEGVKYCSLRFKKRNLPCRVLGRALFPIFAIVELLQYKSSDVAGIMVILGDSLILNYLKKYSKRYCIPVLVDCVEWYSPSEFNNGEKNYYYKQNDRLNRKTISYPLRVVAISTYFEKYFKGKGLSTVRIPVILNVKNIAYSVDKNDLAVVKIVYAGQPGYKDHLFELVQAVSELDRNEMKKLQIHVIGVDSETFNNKWWNNRETEIPDVIFFEGRKPRKYVLTTLIEADFSFLLRPCEERYAKAGFPTKVVESCACGTAMLCNYSSDLSEYLNDGENAIIIPECSIESCKSALRRIIKMDNYQICSLKRNARETAEKYFSLDSFAEKVKSIIEN